jgi:hypothetical protein
MVFHLPDPRDTPAARVLEDIHSTLSGHNQLRELTNGFRENDPLENIFADVIDNTYGRSATDRNSWRRTADIQDDFGIDYSYDRFVRNEQPEMLRTSRQLMTTLDRHAGGINIGRHNDHLTKSELRNYLTRVGDNISPQDKADLCLVMRDFDQIARADGKQGKGISYRDMAAFVQENRLEDRMIMIQRQNDRLREQNARLREELDRGDAGGYYRGDERGDYRPGTQNRQDSGRVITDKTGPNGHYRAEGTELPLSQEEFKAHYGIPQNIDLTKFMRGKNNDGQVPNFWTSEVAAGLGGRDDNNNLRWDNPAHHEASLDFQRNFAQLAEYFDKLPIHQQMEFTFNFARTQGEVLRSNGVSLLAADNEKIQIIENGATKYIDLVQDVDSDRKLLQWG